MNLMKFDKMLLHNANQPFQLALIPTNDRTYFKDTINKVTNCKKRRWKYCVLLFEIHFIRPCLIYTSFKLIATYPTNLRDTEKRVLLKRLLPAHRYILRAGNRGQ